MTEIPLDTMLAYAAGQPDEELWTLGRLMEDLGATQRGVEYARRKMAAERFIRPGPGLWLTRRGAEECRKRGMSLSSGYTY